MGSIAPAPYENDVDVGAAGHTQISSLVASAPEFLATLPSFRAQSPPTIYRNVDHCATPISGSPPNAPIAPAIPGAERVLSPAVERVSSPTAPNVPMMALPLPVVSPVYVGAVAPPPMTSPVEVPVSYPLVNACATALTASSADTSPQHGPALGSVQRSSSICEAIVAGSHLPMAPPEMMRTESVPALAAYSSPFHDAFAIPSNYVQLQQQSHLQTAQTAPSYHISAAQSAFMTTEACAAQSAVPVAPQVDALSPQSPLRMAATLPVYSGFAQLTTDGVRSAEESNAKQFFYQNW